MYKIKKCHEKFDKAITLLWLDHDQSIEPWINYHPAKGYHGSPGHKVFVRKNFGDLEYALKFMNSEACHRPPEYCEVCGNRSLLSYWFEETTGE